MTDDLRIAEGATYRCTNALPARCLGQFYLVRRFVVDVPTYSEKVLVECLTGDDAGRWFTVSPANFATRYAGPLSVEELAAGPGVTDAAAALPLPVAVAGEPSPPKASPVDEWVVGKHRSPTEGH